MITVELENGSKFKSYRKDVGSPWEFITCGEYGIAKEVAEKVKKQGKHCEVDFWNGWFVRVRVEQEI